MAVAPASDIVNSRASVGCDAICAYVDCSGDILQPDREGQIYSMFTVRCCTVPISQFCLELPVCCPSLNPQSLSGCLCGCQRAEMLYTISAWTQVTFSDTTSITTWGMAGEISLMLIERQTSYYRQSIAFLLPFAEKCHFCVSSIVNNAALSVECICVCRLRQFQGDIIAGIAVGLTVVPQSLAYAKIAELPPQVCVTTCLTTYMMTDGHFCLMC